VPKRAEILGVLVENGGHGATYNPERGESHTSQFLQRGNSVNFKAGIRGIISTKLTQALLATWAMLPYLK
jgi:hypothetical protein